jgi:hypothetical protein
MMQKFGAKMPDKLQETIANGKDWGRSCRPSLKASTRKDWVEYRENSQTDQRHRRREQIRECFCQRLSLPKISHIIANAGFENTGFITDNIEAL